MDATQRQKVTQQLLKIANNPDRRSVARHLFCEEEQVAVRALPSPSIETRFHRVWTSTPIWGALGVLLGAIVGHISRLLLFVFVGVVIWVDLMRVGFFVNWNRALKVSGNAGLAVIVGIALVVVWELSPAPKEQPTFDQQVEMFIDKIGRKFPAQGKVDSIAITQGTTWTAHDILHGIYFLKVSNTEITPINVLADYTLTNVTGNPVMIKLLSIEMLGKYSVWWPLVNLPTYDPIWSLDTTKPHSSIGEITLPEGFLKDKIENTELPAGHSVRGWMLCQIPVDYVPFTRGTEPAPLRLHVRDTADNDIFQTVRVTYEDNAISTEFQFKGLPNEDSANYKIAPYSH